MDELTTSDMTNEIHHASYLTDPHTREPNSSLTKSDYPAQSPPCGLLERQQLHSQLVM